jgi:hypothetical protein
MSKQSYGYAEEYAKIPKRQAFGKPSLTILLATFCQLLLLLPASVSSQTLQASYLQYDAKKANARDQQLPVVSLTNPKLEFLSVSSCDLGSNMNSNPCCDDEIGSFAVRIQSDHDDFEDALDFRFFGIGGATLRTKTWLQMDSCGRYNVAFSEIFSTFASSSSSTLRSDDNNDDDDDDNKDSTYRFQRSGRLRFQDLTGRPGCNGIESFSVEFQLDRYRYDDSTDEMDLTSPAPIFGWISYQSNSTNLGTSPSYQDIMQQFELDQVRTSVSTLVPVADPIGSENSNMFSEITFPTTRRDPIDVNQVHGSGAAQCHETVPLAGRRELHCSTSGSQRLVLSG